MKKVVASEKGFSPEVSILVAAVAVVALLSIALYFAPEQPSVPILPPKKPITEQPLPKFVSCSAIAQSFKEAQGARGYGIMEKALGGIVPSAASTATGAAEGDGTTQSFSGTNVQVQGVDEADIVKTDGTYIYTLSAGKLVISKAYPAESAEVLSRTDLKENQAQEMFVEKNKLLVFGQKYYNYYDGEPMPMASRAEIGIYPYWRMNNLTVLQLWDVSNRAEPKLERELEFEGSYLSSRKIGSKAYFVINSYPDYRILEKPSDANETLIPAFKDSRQAEGFAPVSRCIDIGYLPPIEAQSFITVGAVSMSDPNSEVEKKTVVGSGENVFASLENIYIAQTHYNYEEIQLPIVSKIIAPREANETTAVHKFALDNGKVKYQGSGEAPGHILNQFSMDEFEGNFRIATTVGEVWGGNSKNNIYVLDKELKTIGKLEDLAPGEKIYSARFMGKKAYLVTFKKVDPLFVIDLSEPTNPRVLGKLKIPGYSDYLHPFDETHIIGVGKEAVDAEADLVQQRNLDFAWYQGMKIALFDVSDVEHPKEMFKVMIGDRGTDSYALHDHKAFLFDRDKQLLVLPITLAELTEEQKKSGQPTAYGEFTFQGAFVYNLSLDKGFELKGKITHYDTDDTFRKAGSYYFGDSSSVKRSLYIENVLYTVSDTKIKANNLSDLSLVKELRLSAEK